jgi:hypothetical protein
MSKRLNKDIRQKLAIGIITSGIVASGYSLSYADSRYEESDYRGLGFISAIEETGPSCSPAKISTGEGDGGGKSYGIPQFTSEDGGASANIFVKWLKTNYPDMWKNFEGVGIAGTSSFDSAWIKTAEEYDNFADIQMEFAIEEYIEPFYKKAKRELGIDFTATRALQEFSYSSAFQFGASGAVEVLKKGGVNSSMTEVEILEAATAEKIKSSGTYKFLTCSKQTQEDVKVRFARELEQYKKIIDGTGYVSNNPNGTTQTLDEAINAMKEEKENTLDNLVQKYMNNEPTEKDTNSALESSNKEEITLGSLVEMKMNVTEENKETSNIVDTNDSSEDTTDEEVTLDSLVKDIMFENLLDKTINIDILDPNKKKDEDIVDSSNPIENVGVESDSADIIEEVDNEELVDENVDNQDEDMNNQNEDTEDSQKEVNTEENNEEAEDITEDITLDTLVEQAKETVVLNYTENQNSDIINEIQDKLDNNMFGKFFKMTKEIVDSEDGIKSVREKYLTFNN